MNKNNNVILLRLFFALLMYGASYAAYATTSCNNDPYTAPTTSYFAQLVGNMDGTETCTLMLNTSATPTIRISAYVGTAYGGVSIYSNAYLPGSITQNLSNYTINGVPTANSASFQPAALGNVYVVRGEYTYLGNKYTVQATLTFTGTVAGASGGTGDANVTISNSSITRLSLTPAPTVTNVTPASGSTTGGTSITITGTDFTGATGVTIGGVAATSVTVVNATTITATTPAGTVGAKNVVVTTPAGSGTGSNLFTYGVDPTVASVSPSNGSLAGGTNITITGANFTGTTSVTIGGVSATNFTVVNATTITAVTPAGSPGQKNVSVTTPSGTGVGSNLFTYGQNNPLDDPNVSGLIQSQTTSTVRVAEQSLRAVNSRLVHLVNSNSNSTSNDSSNRVQLAFASDRIDQLMTVLSDTALVPSFNSSGDIFENGWAIWTEGSIVVGEKHRGSLFRIDGITLGADKKINPDLTLGLAYRFGEDDDEISTTLTSRSRSHSISAYSSYVLNKTTYFQAAIGYSDIEINSRRTSSLGIESGTRDAEQFYFLTSIARQFLVQKVVLYPFATFKGSHSKLKAFSEKGSIQALKYHQQTIDSLAGSLGIRGHYDIQTAKGIFRPRLSVEYDQNFNRGSRATVHYVTTPTSTYSRRYNSTSSATSLLNVGLDYQYASFNFSLEYERTEQINWGHSDGTRLMVDYSF